VSPAVEVDTGVGKIMQQAEQSTQRLNLVLIVAGAATVIGIVFSVVGAASDVDHFFHIYLLAFTFWLEIALGCLGLLLLTHLVDSRWGLSVQRVAAAGASTLPFLALLFLPILLGLDRVYPWAEEGVELIESKEAYYNVGFFAIRAVIYFAVWIGLAFTLIAWSNRSDKSDDPDEIKRLKERSFTLSIIGGILYFFTASFAGFDWTMSLNIDWMSSIYGWLAMGRMAVSAMALVLIVLPFFWSRSTMARVVNLRVVMDLGTLLLVSLLIWMYMNAMQFIVIWSGNQPGKASWYTDRTGDSWEGFVLFLIGANALALIILLTPGLKRFRSIMIGTAVLLMVLRVVDLFWTIMPANNTEFVVEWWDFAPILATGGVWVALFFWILSSRPVVPVNHPVLQKTLVAQEEETYEPAS
jgi:hypothetical protein